MSDNSFITSEKKIFWREPLLPFAERLYAFPEVEKICLHLQDEYHVNVNILLWTFWVKSERLPISAHWLDEVLINIDTSSQLTVSRLREIRRMIKNTDTFTRVQAVQVCKHILQAELKAERIFLQRLEDLAARFIESKTSAENIALISPAYYLGFLGVSDAPFYVEDIASHIAAL